MANRTQEWWDRWYLGLCDYIATASKDPSTKVGSVIIDDKRRIVSTGYNGFPRGIEDSMQRLENREIKYKLVRHAEANSLSFSQRNDLSGCTLYTSLSPCSACASTLIQHFVSRVVFLRPSDKILERWLEDFKLAYEILREANIEITVYDRRDQDA